MLNWISGVLIQFFALKLCGYYEEQCKYSVFVFSKIGKDCKFWVQVRIHTLRTFVIYKHLVHMHLSEENRARNYRKNCTCNQAFSPDS